MHHDAPPPAPRPSVGEQARALLRVAHRGHDDLVEEGGCCVHDLDVSDVHRIERAGVEDSGHGVASAGSPGRDSRLMMVTTVAP